MTFHDDWDYDRGPASHPQLTPDMVKQQGWPIGPRDQQVERVFRPDAPGATTVFLGLPTEDVKRKRLQMWTYLLEYFPDAFLAEVEVSVAGNEQHNPGQRLHWARGKSMDQMNTAFRHMWDYGRGVKKDTDGQWHLAKARWRLGAQLQLDIEEERATMNALTTKPAGTSK